MAWRVVVVTNMPRAQWPKDNPEVLLVFPIALILVGWKWCFASSARECDASGPASDQQAPQLTDFEKYISFGVSRQRFYGIGCMILGIGMAVPIIVGYLRASTQHEANGWLVCSAFGPLPLIACGAYILLRPKQPGNRPPRRPGLPE
jgi:hypothetical protein